MKIFNFYFFLICFLFAGGVVNSQTLNKIYSGEKLPAGEGWQELKLDASINSVAGTVLQEATDGVLKLKSTNAEGQFTQLGWYKTNLGLNYVSGYTIEIKAKVTDASKYGAFNIQGYDNEGKGFRLGIYDNYLAEQTSPFAATNVLKSGLTNGDGFHIYRIAVQPTGTATLYRDDETIGTFPLSAFYFDNIIENGGFEDGDDPNDASFFPDFTTNALMYRSNNPDYFASGGWGFIMDNEEVEPLPDAERARTRELAVKPNADYNISISRKRIVDPFAWRDMGAFWNTQDGTQNGADNRDDNAIFAGANEPFWQTHNQKITAPDNVTSLRFEFPCWVNGPEYWVATAFDNFYFSEDYGLQVGPQIDTAPAVDPVFPEGYVNLIQNGDFEDYNLNNDGTEYEWALSEENNDNRPVGYNPVWGGYVRIQKNDKADDELGGQWAHSGTSSLRFSSLNDDENPDRPYNFNYAIKLEPNKTYRYNFWMRSPHWDDFGSWLKVKIGDNVLWGHELKGRNNVWSNVDLVFTTTDENTTLSLYTECGGWFNIYLDDFVLYEVTEADPNAGKTNLFVNGNFEDITLGNDGQPYDWALASTSSNPADDNYPVAWSDFWGTYVRLQDVAKSADTGVGYAHNGTKSMRFSRLQDNEKTNMDMKMDLKPNKTYTLVFYFKTANYGDVGTFYVANSNRVLWGGAFGTQNINWSKQTVTFSTTAMDHTLRMYTDISGWFNFYLDDIALYEEDTYVPLNGDSYLFFGKSTGSHSADVEIEYVAIDNTGAYAPGDVAIENINNAKNLNAYSFNGILTLNAATQASVIIYNVAGVPVSQFVLNSSKSVKLPQGVYIVKSVSQGVTETLKVVNK